MVLGSIGYLAASFILFGLDLYHTNLQGLGVFGYFYLTKPSTASLIIRYNFAIAVMALFLRVLAHIASDKLDENDDQKFHDHMRIRAIGVLVVTFSYLWQFDAMWFLVLVAEFGHYLCHQYLAIQAERLWKWHSPVISDYIRVLACYLLLLFVDFELIWRGDLRTADMESRLLCELIVVFAMSLGPFLGLLLATWQAHTHCEFKRIRSNWQKILMLSYSVVTVLLLGGQGWLMVSTPSKNRQEQRNLFFVQLAEILWMAWRFHSNHKREEVLKQKIKEIEEVHEDEMGNESDKLCVVCFRDMERGRRLACKHILHEDCLKVWLEKTSKEKCPKCKQSIYNKQQPSTIKSMSDVGRQAEVVHQIEPLMTVTRQVSQPIHTTNKLVQQASTISYAASEGEPADPSQPMMEMPRDRRQDMSEPTLKESQIAGDRAYRSKVTRIGSVPFGLPTEAVYRRTKQHFQARTTYLQRLPRAD